MPSAPLINASKQLPKLVVKMLDEAGLAHGDVRVVSSPRRLAAIESDVACATEAVHEVKRGPKAQIAFDADGNPIKAAAGFARKCGIDASELTREVDEDGNEYVPAERNVPSEPAMPILSALGHDVIAAIEWPNYRSQRWGSEHETFVRPIRWICALLGSEVVPVTYADVTSGNTTRGHRVLAPGEHAVAEPAAYEQVLMDSYVLGARGRGGRHSRGHRRNRGRAPRQPRGHARPHLRRGREPLREADRACPAPSMRSSSACRRRLSASPCSQPALFPIFDAEGKLTREFAIVSNADPKVSDTVSSGNERVVRPRLDDAKFFFDEDLKRPMEEFVERLGIVTFQEKLSTTLQKVQRMKKLAGAGRCPQPARMRRASRTPCAPHTWPRQTSSRRPSSSSPTSRASWAAITPRPQVRPPRFAPRSASTIVRASQVTIFPPASAASASLSPTSSTLAVASSPSTSPRRALPTPTPCAAPPSASSPCCARCPWSA